MGGLGAGLGAEVVLEGALLIALGGLNGHAYPGALAGTLALVDGHHAVGGQGDADKVLPGFLGGLGGDGGHVLLAPVLIHRVDAYDAGYGLLRHGAAAPAGTAATLAGFLAVLGAGDLLALTVLGRGHIVGDLHVGGTLAVKHHVVGLYLRLVNGALVVHLDGGAGGQGLHRGAALHGHGAAGPVHSQTGKLRAAAQGQAGAVTGEGHVALHLGIGHSQGGAVGGNPQIPLQPGVLHGQIGLAGFGGYKQIAGHGGAVHGDIIGGHQQDAVHILVDGGALLHGIFGHGAVQYFDHGAAGDAGPEGQSLVAHALDDAILRHGVNVPGRPVGGVLAVHKAAQIRLGGGTDAQGPGKEHGGPLPVHGLLGVAVGAVALENPGDGELEDVGGVPFGALQIGIGVLHSLGVAHRAAQNGGKLAHGHVGVGTHAAAVTLYNAVGVPALEGGLAPVAVQLRQSASGSGGRGQRGGQGGRQGQGEQGGRNLSHR